MEVAFFWSRYFLLLFVWFLLVWVFVVWFCFVLVFCCCVLGFFLNVTVDYEYVRRAVQPILCKKV